MSLAALRYLETKMGGYNPILPEKKARIAPAPAPAVSAPPPAPVQADTRREVAQAQVGKGEGRQQAQLRRGRPKRGATSLGSRRTLLGD